MVCYSASASTKLFLEASTFGATITAFFVGHVLILRDRFCERTATGWEKYLQMTRPTRA